MAIIPFARLVAGTARAGIAEGAVGALVNLVLDQFCQDSQDVEEWQAAQRAGIPGAVARSVQPLTRSLRAQYCPASPPPQRPLQISGGVYGVGGASFGTVAGYSVYENPGTNPTRVVTANFTAAWGCQDNRGLPVGAPRVITRDGGTSQFNSLAVRMRRADGTEYDQSLTNESPAQFETEYTVLEFNVRPCTPGIVPIIPPAIVLPPRPGNPVPVPRPEFPINIPIPNLPGLPPILIPIIYAPIQPTLNLQPRITLRPTINLPGLPNFAPDITLDLGGISVGGGGDVTIGDIENIINEGDQGGECPDPCPELDYDRIEEIVFDELDKKFPPARPTTLLSTVTAAKNSDTLILPPFTVSVDLQMVEPGMNVPSQFGGADAPNVVFNGWYSYGVNEESSERIPFNYDSISVPIPSGVRFFSYTITRLGTAIATVRYLQPNV